MEKEFQKMKYLQTITCDNIFFKYYVFVTNNIVKLLRKNVLKTLELTEKQIIVRIRSHGRGFVFTAKLFSGLTNDLASVRTALTRLVR